MLITNLVSAVFTCKLYYLRMMTIYMAICFSLGELDPERMGSGIQYGDAALRQLRSPRRAQAQSAQECGC